MTPVQQEDMEKQKDDLVMLNLVDLNESEFEKRPEKRDPDKPHIGKDLETKREVSKALMDQINGLPKILRSVAKDYLREQNYPALKQFCDNNNYDYKKVTDAIIKEREKEGGNDFMAILLDVEVEMDKQRGPLVRAFLFSKAIDDENLAAADLFLKHMKKETKDDKRAILTTIELPDPD